MLKHYLIAITTATILCIGGFFVWFFYPLIERGIIQMMDTTPLPQEVTLHFGHQGMRDFYTYTHGKSDDYPEIMSFSSLRWQPPNLGRVTLSHFGSSVEIPYVFLAMGTHNGRRTDGIGIIDIDAGLSQAEFTTAEQAYQDYVALITAFKQAGWQQYFEPWNARIAKEDNVKLLSHRDKESDDIILSSGFASDGVNALTFKEWQYMIAKQEKNGYGFVFNLNLYLRDIVAWVKIIKTNTKTNPIPNQPDLEQYMVAYRFTTAKYDFYSQLSEEKTLDELRQFYDENQQTYKRARQDEEDTAIRVGFRIDESYQDPDMWQYIIEPAY